MVLFYTTLAPGSSPRASVQQVLAWTQIILIMVLFYGGQAIFRDPQARLEMLAYTGDPRLEWLPTTWVADGVVGQTAVGPTLGTLTVLALLLWGAALLTLTRAWGQLEPARRSWSPATQGGRASTPGPLVTSPLRAWLRDPLEAAGFLLGWRVLAADHDLRMRAFPAMGFVFAPVVLGLWLGELGTPTQPGPLALVGVYLMGLPMAATLHQLNYSRDHRATWVLRTNPIDAIHTFNGGLHKAATLRLMLPMALILVLLLSLGWRAPGAALATVGLGWLALVCVGQLARPWLLPGIPLARSPERAQSFGPDAMLATGFGSLGVLGAPLHSWLATDPIVLGLYGLGLGLVALGLTWWNRRPTL